VKINKLSGQHYEWGQKCDGWHLLRRDDLSVIQERMPPGAFEVRHFHAKARQFFFVLKGVITIEINDERFHLEEHEGIEVAPGVSHQVFNDSGREVEFILVSSPPAQGDRVLR
jgi:mannose-6-phosphate isomerase-like protein (cupin superfamily)